jgi:hypothetical protein
MLMMTPEYAAIQEDRARQTVEWLEGNFELKKINPPVVARMVLGQSHKGVAKTKK